MKLICLVGIHRYVQNIHYRFLRGKGVYTIHVCYECHKRKYKRTE